MRPVLNRITGAYVVMGVSGCGKTTVAKMLAGRTGGLFLDADDFHPAANREKMRAGIPLTDDDRWPWLETLNRELKSHVANERPIFLACSALRQVYRDKLAAGLPNLRFIYLKAPKELIRERLKSRKDHFMPLSLLESQFSTLEEPLDAVVVSADGSREEIIEAIFDG